jgi:hypothetical protein
MYVRMRTCMNVCKCVCLCLLLLHHNYYTSPSNTTNTYTLPISMTEVHVCELMRCTDQVSVIRTTGTVDTE